jgi:hypothetical protein
VLCVQQQHVGSPASFGLVRIWTGCSGHASHAFVCARRRSVACVCSDASLHALHAETTQAGRNNAVAATAIWVHRALRSVVARPVRAPRLRPVTDGVRATLSVPDHGTSAGHAGTTLRPYPIRALEAKVLHLQDEPVECGRPTRVAHTRVRHVFQKSKPTHRSFKPARHTLVGHVLSGVL